MDVGKLPPQQSTTRDMIIPTLQQTECGVHSVRLYGVRDLRRCSPLVVSLPSYVLIGGAATHCHDTTIGYD